MGEVYRAHDTRLEREVAIKVLPEELVDDEERLSRFEREAKTLASPNHPNVAGIHGVDQEGDVYFLALELVPGEDLSERLSRGPLPVDEALDVCRQITKGLDAAHEAGVVHRDLKPANIRITTNGVVKILDFGLAKPMHLRTSKRGTSTAQSDSFVMTSEGMILGTPTYMSPEQARGKPIDRRTDIWAFGCVLYECLTGKRAFEGDTFSDVTASILKSEPEWSVLNSRVSAQTVRLLRRCLHKDPAKRIRDIRDVGLEIDELLSGDPTASAQPSGEGSDPARADEGFRAAVLPFKYSGTNADLKALAEGMSEEIVTGLSRFSYLRVIARGATRGYADDVVDVRAAGREIGARYVMEGSLRQAGSLLRIAVQLIDVTSGAHLWAETYNRPFDPDEIFALQDDLVPQIVSTVADAYGILPHTMSQAVRSKNSDQLSPYEALLRSFSYAERVTAAEHAEAKAGLERAVEQAPGFSDCWAMLSIMLADEYGHGFGEKPEVLDRALQAARQAVDADPSNHRAYQAQAWALFLRKEFNSCCHAGKRALALNSMDACTAAYVGQTLAFSGEWERGCALVERARQLNPNHPGWYWYASFLDAYRKSDYRGALSLALKMNLPGVSLVEVALAATYGQLGEGEAAGARAVRDLLALKPDYAAVAHQELGKWFDAETTERLIDGLRKAGLAVPMEPGSV